MTAILGQQAFTSLHDLVPLQELLGRITETTYRDEAATRCAWVYACHQICHDPEGCKFFITQTAFVNYTLTLTTDSSIFVASAARDFVAFLLVHLHCIQNPQENKHTYTSSFSALESVNYSRENQTSLQTVYQRYCEYMCGELSQNGSDTKEWIASLYILHKVCDKDKYVAQSIILKHSLVESLITVQSLSQQNNERKTVLEILALLSSDM